MSKVAIVVVALCIVAAGVGVAMALNYLPNPLVSNVAAQYPGASLLPSDISWLSNIGIDSDTIEMLAELNIKVYGINGVSADSVVSWYESKNARDGWSVVSEATMEDRGIGWRYYIRGWQKGIMGQLIMVGDGAAVKRLGGYDTIVVTSSAMMSTYMKMFGGG